MDELNQWTEEHLKSALIVLIEAARNSVRGRERGGSEHAMNGIFDQIIAAWNARAPAVPEGYALVPVVPTEEMITKGANCVPIDYENGTTLGHREDIGNAYAAMLAAAPKVTPS